MLFDILVYVSGGLGFLVHYVIPHLRKEMPWMCCSHPLLQSHERGQFEVKGLLLLSCRVHDLIHVTHSIVVRNCEV